MLERGAWFVSSVHDDAVIDATLEVSPPGDIRWNDASRDSALSAPPRTRYPPGRNTLRTLRMTDIGDLRFGDFGFA